MRAINLMFDSLNRHMVAPYADVAPHLPNFARLAARTVTFEKFYAGSMPCMPARRELHTGRQNFLHRSWGPLEPFDDSVPALLAACRCQNLALRAPSGRRCDARGDQWCRRLAAHRRR